MPNYCSNHLIIYGDKNHLAKFILDHNINTLDQDNEYDFLKDIKDYIPLYQRREERMKELYPEKTYTLRDEELSTSIETTPDFSVLLPTPKEEEWYEWQIEKWGTKWNSSDASVYFEWEPIDFGKTMNINFSTAWSPPREWLQTAAKYYPDLQFEMEYYEPGCDFWGKIQYANGEIITEEKDSYCEHLLKCPSLPDTLQQIKNLPFENDYPIKEYIQLFNTLTYHDDDCYDIDDLAETLTTEYENISENKINIVEQIAVIWTEMIDSIDLIYYDLKEMFHHFVKELLAHYKKIQKVIHYICQKRMKLRLTKLVKRSQINKHMIDFAYLPENPESSGTILERGGYLYREAKDRFENLSV